MFLFVFWPQVHSPENARTSVASVMFVLKRLRVFVRSLGGSSFWRRSGPEVVDEEFDEPERKKAKIMLLTAFQMDFWLRKN